MKKQLSVFVAILGALLSVGCVVGASAHADTTTSTVSSLSRDVLQSQIQDKAKQLDVINQQLASTTASLKTTTAQRQTLQQQVGVLNGNIKTLNLGIQADTLTVQQLQLEIQGLGYDIQDIESSVSLKQAAIEDILKEFQKNDAGNGNLLALFLKSGSLADGVLEAQSLSNLQSQLSSDIDNLKSLHDQYNGKLQESSTKRNQVVVHQGDLANKKVIVQDQTVQKQQLLTTTKNQESIYQKQLSDLQKQQQETASDIEALDAVLRLKIDPSTLPAMVPGVLLVPIANDTTRASITQGYGATDFAKNGYQGHWHNGIDLSAPIGTPVLAADDGTIAATGNQDAYCRKGAYGRFVVINHTNYLTTLYGHLSKILVSKGDIVKRGQVIGYSGQTGYATGPHLHLTVYAQATFYMGPSKVCGPMPYGGDLNPIPYLF
ncbi:MAG: peptidoglycan DD-metalloendopeptidase family protein [Minisyncoccia bacterium]|jgi:murein DD-endopeptidase MepM/ murein hydrolase activator NlpD